MSVVITVAPTGPIASKADNPGLPTQPREIAEAVHQAYLAGASVAHIHLRDSRDQPTADLGIARRTMDLIAERCPILIQLSTGVGLRVPFEERAAPVPLAAGLPREAHQLAAGPPPHHRALGDRVSNTAPQPVPVANDRGALTAVMDGTVAILSMGLAPYNLLDRALTRELIAGLAWARQEGARAVILRSSLRHFSAGADLDTMIADAGQSDLLDWGLTETLRAFDEHPAPIIASVQGVCVGGGFELALACDLIVASESAKLGSVEVTVGLHPLMGAVQRLTQRAGAARAKEMALLGRRYPAATLERWNIISWVVADEQLDSATMVLAQELAHGPSLANAATKRLVSVAVNEGIAAADEAMAEIQRPIIRSADFRAGVRSYRENGLGMAEFEGR